MKEVWLWRWRKKKMKKKKKKRIVERSWRIWVFRERIEVEK